jgi:outer membrane protein OmpA-like peptidoglycan-associated protein
MTLRSSAAAALFLAAAAASGAHAQVGDPAYRPKFDPAVRFPDKADSWIRKGLFVSPGAVLQVTPGLSKAQVSALLGPPHYSNPWPFVRVWNYILDFHTGVDDSVVQCQYQVRFAGSPPVVQATYWKDTSCGKYLEEVPPPAPVAAAEPLPPPPPTAPPVAEPAPKPAAEAKAYVVYFPFDSAELTEQAKAVIADAATYEQGVEGGRAIVVGFADTSGAATFDQRLSERRAIAVADTLESHGVPGSAIDVSWKGKTELAVDTPDGVKQPLNRRVTIKVTPAN